MSRNLAAASIMGQLLGGLALARRDAGPAALVPLTEDALGASFSTDEDGTVRAQVVLPSGDVYEISVRWLDSESP